MTFPDTAPTIRHIREAARRIAPHINRTPVLTSASLDGMTGCRLFFKCENLQKVGAFKFRGACHAVSLLDDARAARGVATHSSGNHAAALALAARIRHIPSCIVMPENAPGVKKRAVAGYGAEIVFCRPTLADREATLEKVIQRTGAEFVHPYNDYRVIAGQATAALELLADMPALDFVMAPVGGGGLLSGTALTVRAVSPATAVLGAEPAGADDACRSLQAGRIIPQTHPQTVADGLRTSLGEKTFPIIQRLVQEILTVSEDGILQAMRRIWERMKIIIEPSAAVPLAAVFEHPTVFRGRRVGIILSGGNVDLDHLPWPSTPE
ncbi:MAG: pyridoxal-phosphate dependent enzyme [Acidobacteria bacterium]|nr:pyridoxal-phosphate dependent enzyme [Acidobacteriota bacterium]